MESRTIDARPNVKDARPNEGPRSGIGDGEARSLWTVGHTVRASKEEPQYLIKSDKTDHLAMHKGAVLRKVRAT